MRKFAPISLAVALLAAAFISLIALTPTTPTAAQVRQTSTPIPSGGTTTNTTGTPTPGSAVDAFFVACSDAAVVNLSGTLLTNFSVYFQLFASDGSAVTNLRRVEATGDFTFSERVAYPSGTALGGGAALTMQVIVARTTDSSRVDFDFVVSDVQDGCQSPQFTLGTSADTGTSGASDDTTGSTVTGVGFTTSLLAPNGVLNPNLQPETAVVIGARPSERFRSQTPGLIFAECNEYPLANPGIVYDSDRVTVFWSWFTKTQEQMQQHLANAQYSVRMNRAIFNRVQVSEPTVRNGNVWVFYTADAGNLRPGHYEVEYRLTWAQPVNDGYQDFGPGTSNTQEAGNCNYNVLQNPNGTSVFYNDEFFPTDFPVHNLFPDT